MENTEVPKEKSQAALYFKPRYQLAKFTTKIDESNPAGVWREWTNPKTNEPGKTYELQLDKIQGYIIDARISESTFPARDGEPERKEKSFLLALEDQQGTATPTVRVLKLKFADKYGMSREFKYFALRCNGLATNPYTTIEFWMPPNSERGVILYKQDEGGKWPTTIKSQYKYDEDNKQYIGLPEVVVTEDFAGNKQYNSTEQDKKLLQNVEEFCEFVQQANREKTEEPVPAADYKDIPDDEPPF